jgi:uncharacterized protein (DUF3084 family)
MALKKEQQVAEAKQDYVDACEIVDRIEAQIEQLREELRLLHTQGRFMALAKDSAGKRLRELVK